MRGASGRGGAGAGLSGAARREELRGGQTASRPRSRPGLRARQAGRAGGRGGGGAHPAGGSEGPGAPPPLSDSGAGRRQRARERAVGSGARRAAGRGGAPRPLAASRAAGGPSPDIALPQLRAQRAPASAGHAGSESSVSGSGARRGSGAGGAVPARCPPWPGKGTVQRGCSLPSRPGPSARLGSQSSLRPGQRPYPQQLLVCDINLSGNYKPPFCRYVMAGVKGLFRCLEALLFSLAHQEWCPVPLTLETDKMLDRCLGN